jgi:hypothetical protein
MDAINEHGMTPDGPARQAQPMTLRQVLESSQTYFGLLRFLLRAGKDDEARGRLLAKMDHVTQLLEGQVQRQLAEPRLTGGSPHSTLIGAAPSRERPLAQVA